MNPMANIFSNPTKAKVPEASFYLDNFPNCCTANIMCELYDNEKEIIAKCNRVIPRLDDDGYGLVLAITTDRQPEANKAFERMGFYTNPTPIKKDRNTYSGNLHLWFMPVKEFKPIEL